MFKHAIIFILLILAPAISQAKYIYEYLGDIEQLLMERNYSEARSEFKKLGDRFIYQIIDSGRNKSIFHNFEGTIHFLTEADKLREGLSRVENNNIRRKYSGRGNDIFDWPPPRVSPFSPKFVEYLNSYHAETIAMLNETNRHLAELKSIEEEKIQRAREVEQKQKEEEKIKKEEAERLAYEAKQEEQRKQREADSSAHEAQKKKEKDLLDAEILKIDTASKQSGFKGYANQNIVSLIYSTQQKGGLENHLNDVIGCPKQKQKSCRKWYPKVKAIQVLDQGVLYSFSEFNRNELISFVIYVEKEFGKIYQEGQALENTFYVFKGMVSYTTVTGSTKSVPSFSKADITY